MKYSEVERKKKITAIIERGADGSYGVYIQDNPLPFGLIGEGKTVSEAIDDFKNGIEDMRTYYQEQGKEFPAFDVVYKYDTASFLQQYSYAFTLAGLERITGINQRQLSHYINGVRRPSRATVAKIEKSLHSFGSEISQIQFV